MDGLTLYQEIEKSLDELDEAIEDFKNDGLIYATRERDYRAGLCKKTLELRAEDFPVTITQDVARGCDEVSGLRFDRDCAKVIFEADKHAIFSKSTRIRVLESIMKQEFGARQ